MACLPKNAKTGADIRAAVSALLSPLLQVRSTSSQAKTIKDHGYFSSSDGVVPTDDGNTYSSDTEPSSSLMEIEEREDEFQSFLLSLTDDRGNSRVPISNDAVVPPGSCIRVLLEWSERSNELYDISFLEDLPEVCAASGFTAKKTRLDSTTLFSCLDAFLKEEPLGPDDMWLVFYFPSASSKTEALTFTSYFNL